LKGVFALKNINSSFSLSNENIAILVGSLDYFISNKVDGINDATKFRNNIIANNLKNKLRNIQLDFNHKECAIIYLSLSLLNDYIGESIALRAFDDKFIDEFIDENKKYLSTIRNLMSLFSNMLEIFNSKMH